MYVCVCEVITDQAIIAAIRQGCQSVPELRHQLGCGKQCGRCIPTVRNLLRQQRQQRAPAAVVHARLPRPPVLAEAAQPVG